MLGKTCKIHLRSGMLLPPLEGKCDQGAKKVVKGNNYLSVSDDYRR